MLNCQVNPTAQKCLPSEAQLRLYAEINPQSFNERVPDASREVHINSCENIEANGTPTDTLHCGTNKDMKDTSGGHVISMDMKDESRTCMKGSDSVDNGGSFNKCTAQNGLIESAEEEKGENDEATLEETGEITAEESTENVFASEIGMEDMLGLYRCNICCHLYDTLPELRTHVVNHPEVPHMKAYSCDKCEMKFSHKQNLMRHQAVHSGAKPYACKVCAKKFPTATNKKRHERIHDGRRIPCDYCTSSFTQTGDLKKHIRKLHPECFFECAFCGKYFNDERSLAGHLNEHDESIDSNQIEGIRKKQSFHHNIDKDRAESIRLGDLQPGLKFACTICKKKFQDYANMCRHRRLAHQRHLLISKKTGDGEEMCPSPAGSDFSDLDPTSYFYTNVARNIAENLNYFVEGQQEHLENSEIYINWKRNSYDEFEIKQEAECPKQSVNSEETWDQYNFPPGFKPQVNFPIEVQNSDLLSQHGMTRTVLQVPSFHTLETLRQCRASSSVSSPTAVSSATCSSQPASVSGTSCENKTLASPKNVDKSCSSNPISPPAIKVPDFKVCSLCRTVFNKFDLYKEHMKNRHKVDILDEQGDKTIDDKMNKRDIVRLKVQQYITNKQPKLHSDTNPSESAIDLTVTTKSLVFDDCGALDLTSPIKKQSDIMLSCPAKFKSDAKTREKSEDTVTERPNVSNPLDALYPNGKKYICAVCHRDYLEFSALKEHQVNTHPYVHCSHIEVDVSVGATLWQMPNPVGLLNVCSSHIPNIPGQSVFRMMSSSGNTFHFTGPLCGESPFNS